MMIPLVRELKQYDNIFPSVPTELLETWFDEFVNIELSKMDVNTLIKMDEDEIYSEGMMTILMGRWIIWMKEMGFK